MLANARQLLIDTEDLFAYPDEDSKLIRQGRWLYAKLRQLVGMDPYDYDLLVHIVHRLPAVYEQVVIERRAREGTDLILQILLESEAMEELQYKMDGLQGRLPQAELNQMFQRCLDAGLQTVERTQYHG